jgi:acyl-CoA reductase-like NAD-dependent aldehyde dehydrogenase
LEDAERKALMHAIGEVLEAHMAELTQLITEETGKPLAGLNGVGANWS